MSVCASLFQVKYLLDQSLQLASGYMNGNEFSSRNFTYVIEILYVSLFLVVTKMKNKAKEKKKIRAYDEQGLSYQI